MPTLGAAMRTWVEYCVPDRRNLDREDFESVMADEALDQRQMWWYSKSFRKRHWHVLQFYRLGRFRDWDARMSPASRQNRWESLFVCVVGNLGEESLRMLLPGGLEAMRDRMGEIKRRILALDEMDLDGEHDDEAWRGVLYDVLAALDWD